MRPFTYVTGTTVPDASRAVASVPQAEFFAGGTTLVDLMRIDVMNPPVLVGISQLPLDTIDFRVDGIHVGATVTNTELAWHPVIRARYTALSEAILSGGSAQLRNMATTGGNIMQRTRCGYFRDVNAACNKREPGSGCDALHGINRGHAILGTSDKCIAVNPSDMCVALAIFDPTVRTQRVDGTTRDIPFVDFHRLPGDTPERETVLEHGEIITHVILPPLAWSKRSHYVKIRERSSYEFALTSAAVALELDGETITTARIALGGVATKPWRAWDAEQSLIGKSRTQAELAFAANLAVASAIARRDNAFKIELAQRTIVRAFNELLARDQPNGKGNGK
jgi:xanthine dehydrogenase YagS FAD-binding subunit